MRQTKPCFDCEALQVLLLDALAEDFPDKPRPSYKLRIMTRLDK